MKKKALKILVIDDRMTDVEYIGAILRKQGHTVVTAANGYEGLLLAQCEHPDLVLMDVVMPQLNGFQATRELARNAATRDIPVIVVSCKDEEADRVWAMRQGARAYLSKDFSQESLVNVISEVMKNMALQRTGREAQTC